MRDIAEGVSLALAEHRANAISDLRYAVFFSVPESLDEHISGRLDTSLSGHTSPRAADIVVRFLTTKPAYPQRLREKILQSADLLFRSAAILYGWQRPDRKVFGL